MTALLVDTYESGYARSRYRFERETADHQLHVVRDDGLYRHLRFNAPGTYIYGYDLVTWPGYLAIVGDCGDYVFSRVRDMFEFFEADRGRINPGYWAEKLRGPGYDTGRSYSHDRLRAAVLGWARDHCDGGWSDGELVYPSLLIEALEREVLYGWTDLEQEGRERLDILEEQVGYMDCWEWDLRDFDGRFLWCCWAIVRGIGQYRAATVATAEAPAEIAA